MEGDNENFEYDRTHSAYMRRRSDIISQSQFQYSLEHGSSFHRADTEAIDACIKPVDEAVEDMKTWLKTGVTPDGTRMLTDKTWLWQQDCYQATSNDRHGGCESLPRDACVDYYYWKCPFKSHIGNIPLVMMQAQVNFNDGTHMPADRLQGSQRISKNLETRAGLRAIHEKKKQKEFVDAAMDPGAHRGHPLRREGIYTKYFWRPFLKQGSKVDYDPEPSFANEFLRGSRSFDST